MSARNSEAIYQAALAVVKRDSEGAYIEQDLEDAIFARIDLDLETEKRRRAKQIISDRAKVSDEDAGRGQLKLPLGDAYYWQPDRIIRGADGRAIETAKALLDFKRADLERSRKHREDAAKWEQRKQREYDEFSKWFTAQARAGRPVLDLRFGTFVTESGYLIPPAA